MVMPAYMMGGPNPYSELVEFLRKQREESETDAMKEMARRAAEAKVQQEELKASTLARLLTPGWEAGGTPIDVGRFGREGEPMRDVGVGPMGVVPMQRAQFREPVAASPYIARAMLGLPMETPPEQEARTVRVEEKRGEITARRAKETQAEITKRAEEAEKEREERQEVGLKERAKREELTKARDAIRALKLERSKIAAQYSGSAARAAMPSEKKEILARGERAVADLSSQIEDYETDLLRITDPEAYKKRTEEFRTRIRKITDRIGSLSPKKLARFQELTRGMP